MFKSCLTSQAQSYQLSQRAWGRFLTALWGTQHLFNRPALSWMAGWNPWTGWLTWIVECLVYQHGTLPRNPWPLLICAAPICTVETLERKVSNCLRKWIVLLKDLSSIALYRHNNRQQLPFKLLDMNSRQPGQRSDAVMGLRWSNSVSSRDPSQDLQEVEGGGGCSGSICKVGGHGHTRLSWPRILHHSQIIRGKEELFQVQEEVTAAAVEEMSTYRAVGINQQGVWSRWEEIF